MAKFIYGEDPLAAMIRIQSEERQEALRKHIEDGYRRAGYVCEPGWCGWDRWVMPPKPVQIYPKAPIPPLEVSPVRHRQSKFVWQASGLSILAFVIAAAMLAGGYL